LDKKIISLVADDSNFDQWRSSVETFGVKYFYHFTVSIRHDFLVVKAAMKYDWSNGKLEGQLANLPTREDFASLKAFDQEIRERITSNDWEPAPENRRRILELLHARVVVGTDRKIRLEGWFENFDNSSKSSNRVRVISGDHDVNQVL
jgi:hypothetical protein